VGDTVEVFSTPKSVELAEVIDISREKQLVRIRSSDEQDALWVSVGRVYPAPPQESVHRGSKGPPVPVCPRSPPKLEGNPQPPPADRSNVDESGPDDALQAASLFTSWAEPVVAFSKEIAQRLPRCRVPADVEGKGNTTSELKWKLRALSIPFSRVDESGIYGCTWPASRLTADDMKRLRILANLSGLPCNEVLCVAARTLFCQTRSLIDAALAVHEKGQMPLAKLLDDIACQRR